MTIDQIRAKLEWSFIDLTFDEGRHIYYWKGIEVPKSVSGKIKEHHEEFKSDKVVYACAKKEGVSARELKSRWEKTNKDACDLGTNTHYFLENFTGIETPSTPQEEAGIKYLISLRDRYIIIAKEVRMYSPTFNYAGTADLLLWDVLKEQVIIADYKTNKDLFKAYSNLYEPFHILPANNFNKYALQLSYYQIILEEWGIPIHSRQLIYLSNEGEYELHDMALYTNELKELMLCSK